MANRRKNTLITQKNEITESRCDWTIHMSRAYCRVTDMFTQRYQNIKAEKSDISILDKSLLQFEIPRKDLAIQCADGSENMPKVTEFKSAFDRLAIVGIIKGNIDDEENWERINIISGVKYNKKTDSMHVEIGSMMVEYLIELTKKFTSFNPWIAMKFQNSKYTFRFYEFCCQWRSRGDFELSVEELKHRFQLDEYIDEKGKKHPEKYKTIKDFKERVLIPAYEELKELYKSGDCDVYFEYEDINKSNTRGKPTVIGFKFQIIFHKPIKPKEPIPLQPSLFSDANNRLIEIRNILQYYFSNSQDKKWPERAVNELGKLTMKDSRILLKAELLIQDTIHDYKKGKVKNVAATIRGGFKKILDINVDLKNKI